MKEKQEYHEKLAFKTLEKKEKHINQIINELVNIEAADEQMRSIFHKAVNRKIICKKPILGKKKN